MIGEMEEYIVKKKIPYNRQFKFKASLGVKMDTWNN